METKVAIGNIDQISRQRNLFLSLSLLLAVAVVLIAGRLVTFEQRIILVPGLSREMSVTNSDVSSGYLEETALLFLSHLLDISKNDIQHKRDLVLKYTSHSNKAYSKAITEYFAEAEAEYTKFDLATHFTVKNLQVIQNKLEVVANGVMTSWYGKKGHESKEVSYLISFEYSGGFLRLKEFGRVIKDETKNEEKK